MAKPVVRRELANRDVEQAIAHQLREAGDPVARSFVDALEGAYRASAGTQRAARHAMPLS